MRKVKLFLVVSLLCMITQSSAWAAVLPTLEDEIVMQVRLTAIRQDLNNQVVRPGITQSTTRTVRITNKEVLRAMQLQNALPVMPAGTRLVTLSGNLIALAPNGDTLAQVTFNPTLGTSFYDEMNNTNAVWNQRRRAQATAVNLALGTHLAFNLSGLFAEKWTWNHDTAQYLSRAVRFTDLVGPGTLATVPCLITGEITGVWHPGIIPAT